VTGLDLRRLVARLLLFLLVALSAPLSAAGQGQTTDVVVFYPPDLTLAGKSDIQSKAL
jgi:hypothetical protein